MLAAGEAAPTAGLAPHLGDLLAWPGADFAAAAAAFVGAPRLEVVSSGAAALRIAFACLKQRSGRREVIVPGYTCPLVVSAAAAEGLACVACDLEPDSFELDADVLARLITPATLCVVPTHYFGVLTDVQRVRRIVEATDPAVAIVEDAAQAFGGRWHATSAGRAGDIGVYSFGVGKGVTLFEGGGLVARDGGLMDDITGAVSRLARLSPLAEASAAARLVGYHLLYNPLGLAVAYGWPRRRALQHGDDIAAAGDNLGNDIPLGTVGRWRLSVAAAALPRLAAHLTRSRAVMAEMVRRLAHVRELRVHAPPPGVEPTALSMFVTIPRTAIDADLLTDLWKSRHGAGKMFARAIGDYPHLARHMRAASTPRARDLAARTITLSTSERLNGAPWHAISAIVDAFAGR